MRSRAPEVSEALTRQVVTLVQQLRSRSDLVKPPGVFQDGFGWKAILGRGHYHETYRREYGAWKIATLTLTRPFFLRLLTGRFLYADAIGTVNVFAVVYMSRLGGFSEGDKDRVTLVVVLGLLSGVGLSLYVFFHHAPDPSLPANPDQIFPHFVSTRLPVGVAGLLLAALLAATSIPSGINTLAGVLTLEGNRRVDAETVRSYVTGSGSGAAGARRCSTGSRRPESRSPMRSKILRGSGVAPLVTRPETLQGAGACCACPRNSHRPRSAPGLISTRPPNGS